MTLKIISYGGGVQSTAMIVLAAQNQIDFKEAVIVNVGDDSESPDTIRYVREVAIPWADAHGVKIHEIYRTKRNGERAPTILEYHNENVKRNGSTPLPVKMIGDGPGGVANRTCTKEWKAAPVSRWLKKNGATPNDPAQLALGISTDEFHRANTKHDKPFERRCFPLLDLGLSRIDCENLIADAGLEVPPKSACWFCPFNRLAYWERLRRDDPEQFNAVAQLEVEMNQHRDQFGKPRYWWTSRPAPMFEHIIEAQDELNFGDPEDGSCDSGYCWT